MKYFSDKGKPKMHPRPIEEFADDFFEIEDAYAQIEIAGGAISKRLLESGDNVSVDEFPL